PGGLVLDQLATGAEVLPLDRVARAVVLELDRVDVGGVRRGTPVGPEENPFFASARVLDANRRHAERGIGSQRATAPILYACHAAVPVVLEADGVPLRDRRRGR